jgi:transcriptional regulator with XRE-family HTH domain
MMSLANKIKELRLINGLTQEELAHKAGVTYSTVNLLENGKNTNPNNSTLRCIANALGVTVNELKGE